jgi:tetratricopeptide (TPR) repeat protein
MPDEAVIYARKQIEKEDLAAAELCIKEARKSRPSDRQLILQLARILAWQRKFSDANALLVNLKPVDSAQQSAQGDLAWYQANCQAAINHYSAAAELNRSMPLEGNAETNYVRCLWSVGRHQEARSRVDEILEQVPQSEEFRALDQWLKREESTLSNHNRTELGVHLGLHLADQSQNQYESHQRYGAAIRKAKVGSFSTELVRIARISGGGTTRGDVLEILATLTLDSTATTSFGYSASMQNTMNFRRSVSAEQVFKAWNSGVLGLGVRYSNFESSDAVLITPSLEQYLSSFVLQSKLFLGISEPRTEAIGAKMLYSSAWLRPFVTASGGNGEAMRSYLIGTDLARFAIYGLGAQFVLGRGLELSVAFERTLQEAFSQNAATLDFIWFP